MTTSIIHTEEQETAIKYFRKKHNALYGTTFTNGTYADKLVLDLFEALVLKMNDSRSTEELTTAFAAANPTQKAAARTALGIPEP